jgi:hypothetical protein
MRRLGDFQEFNKEFFDRLELAVVSENDKEDRKTITVIVLSDGNNYKNGENGINIFQKFYINIFNSNFRDFHFKNGQAFSIDYLESGFDVVVWGDGYNKNISIKGNLKTN